MLINAGMAHNHLEIKDQLAVSAASGTGDAGPDFSQMLQAVGRRRDRQDFIHIFQHFAPRIKSFFMKGGASPEQADEWAQETMLTVWNKAENYDPARAAASTWIFTIARNKRIDALRRAASRPEAPLPEPSLLVAEATHAPGTELIAAEESHLVAEALDTLPAEQADLIRRAFFAGKSHAEIAGETGLPLGTVKSRIRAALEKLRGRIHEGDVR